VDLSGSTVLTTSCGLGGASCGLRVVVGLKRGQRIKSLAVGAIVMGLRRIYTFTSERPLTNDRRPKGAMTPDYSQLRVAVEGSPGFREHILVTQTR